MALMPRRTRFRTSQRGKIKGVATRGNKVSFGDYGLQSLSAGWITGVQIEAARIAMNRTMKKHGKIWIRVFPDKPVTKRPPETRMGKGKGNPEYWVAVIKPGTVLFEIEGVGPGIAREALRRAANKMSVRTKMIYRQD